MDLPPLECSDVRELVFRSGGVCSHLKSPPNTCIRVKTSSTGLNANFSVPL